VQAGYARLRGGYVGVAIASLLDNMAAELAAVPEQLRREALAIAHFQLDGQTAPTTHARPGTKASPPAPGH
jgi:hypothetical protein